MSRAPAVLPFERYLDALERANHVDYARRTRSCVLNRAAFEEQKEFLVDRAHALPVVASGRDRGGQVFDLMRRDAQPALRGGRIAPPPPIPQPAPVPVRAGVRSVRFRPPSIPGRDDLVPIRRPTLAELTRFPTLGHCLHKHPMPAVAEGTYPAHRYARGVQSVPNSGGSAVLSVWRPNAWKGSFSLAQLWLLAQGTMGAQTVEAGWQVYPDLNSTTQTVLFCGTTADGYDHFSYNNLQQDFVQYHSVIAPGTIINPVSADRGTQIELTVSWCLANGDWWLYVGGGGTTEPVGYYPRALFNGGPLPDGATQVQFGGETASLTGGFPAMGSGQFAASGNGHAAYQHSLTYYTPAGAAQDATLATDENWPAEYTIAANRDPDWGNYFFYGGPGGA